MRCCFYNSAEEYKLPGVEAKITLAQVGNTDKFKVKIISKALDAGFHQLQIDDSFVSELRGILNKVGQSPAHQVGRGVRGELVAFFEKQEINDLVAATKIKQIYGVKELLASRSIFIRSSEAERALQAQFSQISSLQPVTPPGSADDQVAAAPAVQTSDVVLDEVVGQTESVRAVV